MTEHLERRVQELERQLMLMRGLIDRMQRASRLHMSLGRLSAPVVDSGKVQTHQSKFDPLSVGDNIPAFLNYGFSSSLPIGGDQAIVYLTGDRSQGVIVGTNHQAYRFTGLQPGEAVLYDMWGHSLRLTANGAVLTGNLMVTGTVTGGFGGADPVTLLGHEHTAPNGGGRTTAPIAGT